MNIDRLLADAGHHHGLIHAEHAREMGVDRSKLDRLRSRGVLTLEGHSVFRVAGSPSTWRQHALRGTWATGHMGLLSHRSAAALWELGDGRAIEVLVPKGVGARPDGTQVHQTRHLSAVDVDERDGIPVTSIERTLVDLAAVVPMGRLARLLDEAVRAEHTTYKRIYRRLAAMPTRGRSGVRILRILLAERLETAPGDHNPFEAMMNRILGRSELPRPVRQQKLDCVSDRYYLDFAWPEHMVAVECDGLGSHGSPAAMAYDLKRQNDVIEAGWNLRRFPWSEVRLHPARTLATVRRALIASGWSPARPFWEASAPDSDSHSAQNGGFRGS